MSTEKIFGTWDLLPETGFKDEITESWHWLACQNVGTPYFQANSGLTQRRGEFTMLLDLYRRARPQVVLEVGTAQGGSLAAFCLHGRPDATIISIDRDVNDCRPRHNEPVHQMLSIPKEHKSTSQGGGMLHLARHQQRVIPINGWTTSAHVKEELNIVLQGRKIDWCWNDASHSKELFAQDFQWLWPLVAEGGVLCSHDIMPSADPNCDKGVEWERIKREETYSAVFEFRGSRSDDSMGIGALIK